MSTLDYILEKFNLNFDEETPMPLEIPNQGRNNLAEWIHELDFKLSVEVGVAEGVYSEIVSRLNPQMKLYGIDPWKPYRGYLDYTRKDTFKNLYSEAQKRLLGRPNYEFIYEFSMDAVRRFGDNTLDFVYIDANHSDPFITQDITEWTKKVRPGGIVAGHDYMHGKIHGGRAGWDVKEAINRYTRDYKIRPWFLIGLNGKLPGMIRDASRSWMFVKS